MIDPENNPIVLRTDNYDLFKIHTANRPIDRMYVLQLAMRMDKKFLLEYFPIVVDSDMYIMDGQTRFEAAKYLEKPIYYIIGKNIDISDVAELNRNRKWKPGDYIHSYAELGIPEYIELRERLLTPINFDKTSSVYGYKLTYSTVMMFSSNPPTTVKHQINRGKIQINSRSEFLKLLNQSMDIYDGIGFKPSEYLSRGLLPILTHPEYSHEQMMYKLSGSLPYKPIAYFSANDNKRQFADIYNFHSRRDKVIDFDKVK